MIKDFKIGETISQVFLVKDVTKGVTTTGKNYMSILLQDKSGTIEGKKWDIDAKDLENFKKGALLLIDGDVTSFKDKLQLRIASDNIANKEYMIPPSNIL